MILKFLEPLLEEFEVFDKGKILNQFQQSRRNKSALSKLVGLNTNVLLEVDDTMLSILSSNKVDRQEVRELLDWDEDKVQVLTYDELQERVSQLSQLLRLISFLFQLQEDDFLRIGENSDLPFQVQGWWSSDNDVNLTLLPKFYLNLFLSFNLPHLLRELRRENFRKFLPELRKRCLKHLVPNDN